MPKLLKLSEDHRAALTRILLRSPLFGKSHQISLNIRQKLESTDSHIHLLHLEQKLLWRILQARLEQLETVAQSYRAQVQEGRLMRQKYLDRVVAKIALIEDLQRRIQAC